MTFVGAPMIYYGDEAGMWSPDGDPSNREPMTWQDLEPYDDPDVKFNAERVCILSAGHCGTRRQIPTLQVGPCTIPCAIRRRGRHALVFERCSLNGQNAYVAALNRSDHEQRVDFKVDPSDKDTFLMNWLDADNFDVQAALTRPGRTAGDRHWCGAKSSMGTHALNGTVSLLLPAYGTAVLTQQPPAVAK